VPSEPTFSRAFAQFAKQNLGDIAHRSLVQKHVSPAVEAREKALIKRDKPQKEKVGKREIRPPKEPTRSKSQIDKEADLALLELLKACDWSFKKDTNGNEYW
jgi:hypothetical protein